MGLSWGSLGYVVLYWGNSDSVIYAIGIILAGFASGADQLWLLVAGYGVISGFGLIRHPEGLLLLPLAFLGGLAFGAAGMVCTALVPTIELFNLPVFLFITPMFLFGGTFFPVTNLPSWAQSAALAFPLTHLVILVRSIALGLLDLSLLWHLLLL